ncbi:hypothetical protein BGX31_003718 [Mortierella sp. GBA43]|nr:hypothetical protein BGX31_003718 [Mortierella sp. GBA43]
MSTSYKVLIVGAGLSGVTLAILLEQAKIDYQVFESLPGVSPQGGAVVLGPTVMPLLEQLGLLEKVQEICKPLKTMHLVQENLKRIGEINLSDHSKHQIPAHKIRFSKRVVSFSANKDEVTIRCGDDTSYHGEILVGADGAFSKIRELLYKQVAKKGILPRNDALALAADVAALAIASSSSPTSSSSPPPSSTSANHHGHRDSFDSASTSATAVEGEVLHQGGHVSLVGVTRSLDKEAFPMLKEADSRSDTVIGDHLPYSWSYFTVPGDRICWSLNMHLDDNTQRPGSLTKSSSSPPASPSMTSVSTTTQSSSSPSSSSCSSSTELGWESYDSNTTHPLRKTLGLDESRGLKLPFNKTLGDLVDATAKEHVAQAIMTDQQTLFETWYHGRTVLIGDASHRMVANMAHQGAVNAMLDAVILANLIHDLPTASAENLAEIFKEFQADRYVQAKSQMQMNNKVGKVLTGQSWTETLMRKVVVRYISKIYQHFCDDQILADRPQAIFLKQVPSRGHVHASSQRPRKTFDTHSKH